MAIVVHMLLTHSHDFQIVLISTAKVINKIK